MPYRLKSGMESPNTPPRCPFYTLSHFMFHFSLPGDATFADPGVAARGGLESGDMTEVEGRVLPTGFFVIDVKMRPSGETKCRQGTVGG